MSPNDHRRAWTLILPCFALCCPFRPFRRALRPFTRQQTFKSDFSKVSNPNAFADKQPVLHSAISQHFYRHGRFELAELLARVRVF